MGSTAIVTRLGKVARRPRERLVRTRVRRSNRHFASSLGFDPAAPVLILSPHADDAVFNCWSVLTAGTPVVVVNVFAGIPDDGLVTWWDRICGADDSAAHARERIAEDLAVLEPVVGSPVNLPLLEDQYRVGNGQLPLAAIDERLGEAASTASAVYAPAALGAGHVDHRLVRELARTLVPGGMPVRLYADVPYAVRYGWPHWVTGAPRHQHLDVDPYWESAVAEVPEMCTLRDADIVRLPPDAAAHKLRAMRAYRTQFSALDWGGLLSDPVTHGHELFWTLLADPEMRA
jgi:LmbE family N-acetylglucosaminyl deacetylase